MQRLLMLGVLVAAGIALAQSTLDTRYYETHPAVPEPTTTTTSTTLPS